MFDLSIPKLLVLAVIALVVFGPHELPKIASQAGRALRDLRKIAEGAKNDLREGLGPEFADFEIEDLNPKRFVQKHLFDDVNAKYYITDNLNAYVGHRYLGGKNALAFGSEIALPLGHGIIPHHYRRARRRAWPDGRSGRAAVRGPAR